jgi:hypothetical protein
MIIQYKFPSNSNSIRHGYLSGGLYMTVLLFTSNYPLEFQDFFPLPWGEGVFAAMDFGLPGLWLNFGASICLFQSASVLAKSLPDTTALNSLCQRGREAVPVHIHEKVPLL